MGILFAILLFSLLIFIHELGHFVAAKLSGVQVNEFALFMGPAIVKWQWGETKYSIRCIPIGGYCAMEGEDGGSDNPRSFGSAAWWKRLIILLAGAAMNLVLGFLMFAISFAPEKGFVTPVIDQVHPGSTIVSEEGLHLGDRILEVDGEKVYTANDFSVILQLNSQQPEDAEPNTFTPEYHDFVVERQGQKITLNDVKMEKHWYTSVKDKEGNTSLVLSAQVGDKALMYGFSFAQNDDSAISVIDQVYPGCTILSEVGFQLGDRILEVDGEEISEGNDFSMILQRNSQQPANADPNTFVPEYHDFVVERQGRIIALDDVKIEKNWYTPITDNEGKSSFVLSAWVGDEALMYGFSFGVEDVNFGSVMRNSWNSTLSSIQNVRISLAMLFNGKAGIGDLSGPVGIGQQMSQVVDASPSIWDAILNLLYFGGFISVNLCVMNLLPIPALDGGRAVCLVLTTAVEKIRGKKIDPKYEAYLHGIGMILLLALMAFVMFKDVIRIFN